MMLMMVDILWHFPGARRPVGFADRKEERYQIGVNYVTTYPLCVRRGNKGCSINRLRMIEEWGEDVPVRRKQVSVQQNKLGRARARASCASDMVNGSRTR